MRTSFLLLAFFAGRIIYAQDAAAVSPLSLIPAPVSLTMNSGLFTLPGSIVIEAPDQPALGPVVEDLKAHLGSPTGFPVKVTSQTKTDATIRLVLNKTPEQTLGGEGYYLSVTPNSVLIRANQP